MDEILEERLLEEIEKLEENINIEIQYLDIDFYKVYIEWEDECKSFNFRYDKKSTIDQNVRNILNDIYFLYKQ